MSAMMLEMIILNFRSSRMQPMESFLTGSELMTMITLMVMTLMMFMKSMKLSATNPTMA